VASLPPRRMGGYATGDLYELSFEIKDTGIGISPTQLALLFRSFSQVQHINGEYGGTGLGLVISKRLVEAMGGGQVNVVSQLGAGSTFSFEIQADQPADDASHAHRRAHSSSSSASVAKPTVNVPIILSPRMRATEAEGLASPLEQMHGLSTRDLARLARQRVLFVGDATPASEVWVSLLRHYGATVYESRTAADVLKCVRTHMQSSSTQSMAFGGACHVLLLDLDSKEPSIEEDSLMAALLPFAPLHTLCLYSKAHMAHASEKLLRLGYHDVMASPHTQANDEDSPVVIVPAVLALAVDNSLRFDSSLPPSMTPATPAIMSSHGAWATMAGTNDAGGGDGARMMRISLRKPFKLRELLRRILDIAQQSRHAPSPQQQQQQVSASASASSSSAPSKPEPVAVTPASSRGKLVRMSGKYPLRILLAEDNLINQKMMVMLLRRLGYDIAVAGNGLEALKLLEDEAVKGVAHEIQCIIMDASMDVMNGMECTRVIRAQQLPHRTRPFIIAHTANVTDEFRDACLASGMDAFTTKPIHVEQLMTCLRRAYESFAVKTREA
jgi:CheY-like chemotaxis protein